MDRQRRHWSPKAVSSPEQQFHIVVEPRSGNLKIPFLSRVAKSEQPAHDGADGGGRTEYTVLRKSQPCRGVANPFAVCGKSPDGFQECFAFDHECAAGRAHLSPVAEPRHADFRLSALRKAGGIAVGVVERGDEIHSGFFEKVNHRGKCV